MHHDQFTTYLPQVPLGLNFDFVGLDAEVSFWIRDEGGALLQLDGLELRGAISTSRLESFNAFTTSKPGAKEGYQAMDIFRLQPTGRRSVRLTHNFALEELSEAKEANEGAREHAVDPEGNRTPHPEEDSVEVLDNSLQVIGNGDEH